MPIPDILLKSENDKLNQSLIETNESENQTVIHWTKRGEDECTYWRRDMQKQMDRLYIIKVDAKKFCV